MVDVSGKDITSRIAIAVGEIHVSAMVFLAVLSGSAKKGDVLAVARIGGIMAAKRTSELIPLCHPVSLTRCALDFDVDPEGGIIRATCTAATDGRTGVEMEALTGVSVALLTIYDMCKAIDRGMAMGNIRLVHKSGGKSGTYRVGGDADA